MSCVLNVDLEKKLSLNMSITELKTIHFQNIWLILLIGLWKYSVDCDTLSSIILDTYSAYAAASFSIRMSYFWMIAESVAGDHGGRLWSHRFLGSDWLCHARLQFYGHGATALERHAGKPAQTDCAVALAAGGSGEIATTPDATQRSFFAAWMSWASAKLSWCTVVLWLLCCRFHSWCCPQILS